MLYACSTSALPTLVLLALAPSPGSLPTASIKVAAAQCGGGPASKKTSLFVSDNYVPLSQFKHKKSFNGGVPATVTLNVHKEVLDWINPGDVSQPPSPHLRVAMRNPQGVIVLFAPDTVDWVGSAGAVTLQNSFTGDCVVVSDLLLQNPTVATHWDRLANGGRGGQCVGAHDGLFTSDYDPGLGRLDDFRSGSIHSTDPDWGNSLPTGDASDYPYTYASDEFALFSDGSGEHENAEVPGYERYIGESYSTDRFTELAAIWLSDYVRLKTGFPVAHRSYPDAFTGCELDPPTGCEQEPPVPPGHRVENGLPLFQLAHCHLVVPEEGLESPAGYERSLATFVLPPNWTAEAAPDTYPVIFDGYYDINATTFRAGASMMETLATLYCEVPTKPAVGVLWNGGGALACQTFQRSAYANAAKLFDDVECLLKADKHRMVFTGGSRGGTTALALASNPYEYDYTATYVNARAPQLRVGTSAEYFFNPSHPSLTVIMDDYTGYNGSWRTDWKEPCTDDSGTTVILKNFFDEPDPALVDANYSIDSEFFRSRLQEQGTGVVLRVGTHDVHGSSALFVQYANHLLNQHPDVPLLFEIFYRFGHAVPTTTAPSDVDLVRMLFPPGGVLQEGINFYATQVGSPLPRLLDTDHVPLAFELPIGVGPVPFEPGMPAPTSHTWAFIGEPGSRIDVYESDLSLGSGTGGDLIDSVVLSTGSPFAFGWVELSLEPPPTLQQRYYRVEYTYNGITVNLGKGDIAPPMFFPDHDAYYWQALQEIQGYGDNDRTGGVAEDGQLPGPP